MKNIIIYSTKKTSEIAETASSIEDADVRIEASESLKNYEELNPSVIIVTIK